MSIEDLNSINRKMQSTLAKFGGRIDAFLFCPHNPADNCDCRKPKTALLDSFRHERELITKTVRFSEIEFPISRSQKIGARPILVNSGKANSNPPPDILYMMIWPQLCKKLCLIKRHEEPYPIFSFYLGLIPLTVIYSIISILILPLNRPTRYKIITGWARTCLKWLKLTCDLSWAVEGVENITQTPGVIM